MTFTKTSSLNLNKTYLHRIIISQLLKTYGSCSFVSKGTKSNGQEWVGEIHWPLPETYVKMQN